MINFPTTLDGLYINGQWSAGREHLRVINPATEALLTTVNGGDESAVDLAVVVLLCSCTVCFLEPRGVEAVDPLQSLSCSDVLSDFL